jgi:hypothetical protein
MIRLVITGAVVFVVSLAAGAGITVMKAPPPKPAAADSTLVRADSAPAGRDSLIAVSAPPDTHAAAAGKPAAPETAARAVPVTAAHAAAESVRTAATAAPAPLAPPTHAAAPSVAALAASVGDAEGYKQVARVLSNMKPADAAKILAYLTDDQVEGVLRQLGVRQAASLMSVLPVERAAAMSRRMIQHPPEVKP